MRLAANVLVLVVAGVCLGAGSAFSASTNSPWDEVSYKHRGVDLDALGRIVESPDRGKINYSWDEPKTGIGSVSPANLPGLVSQGHGF